MTKRITEKLILKGLVLLLSMPYAMGSWEFNQNRPLDAASTPQAPLEAPLKSVYVGRYRLSADDKKLFPSDQGRTTKERKEALR